MEDGETPSGAISAPTATADSSAEPQALTQGEQPATTNGNDQSNATGYESQHTLATDNSLVHPPAASNPPSQPSVPPTEAPDPVYQLAAASSTLDSSQIGAVDHVVQLQALQQFNNDQGPFNPNASLASHAAQATAPPTAPAPAAQTPVTHITQYYGEIPAGGFSDGFELVTDESAANRMKRDVKRRTKTGCLTCRKRRIKCDERHPVCRNCEKSKRDCLGYDPVFRSQPGPSSLQPAPIAHPSLQVAPQNPHQAAGLNQTYLATGTAHSVSPTVNTATGSSASPPQEKFDFGTEPEPTPLATAQVAPAAPTVPITASVAQSRSVTPRVAESHPLIAASTTLPNSEKMEPRQPKMSELLSIGGFALPEVDTNPLSPTKLEEVKMLYKIYAQGMDRLLECNWYDTHGLTRLLGNPRLLSLYSSLLDGFTDPNIHDVSVITRMESFESNVIWESLCLCRSARALEPTNGTDTSNSTDPQLTYAVKRLSLLEALLTGTVLENNPVSRHNYPEDDPAATTSGLNAQIKNRQLNFWESMGDYLSIPDSDPDASNKRDKALFAARAFLDMIECRDVVYSIAVVRNISKFQPRKFKLPTASDEKDPAAKLYVACRFLEDEVRGKATNQITRRISQLTVRYWDEPYNV
ncbi:hypothetical protein MGYG_06755 [Nannizzia gypsea CBS 118893]|uniref:Zn(2)-C6 fungal-type domain-containing protein n=1 Tax=Arthroderma gypseum (strain ATCC MYA-4604 / CBS 118893) TaxID=535722 RepID=E4V141_ARTGP|nr:hypothetical protein MGYG_06755 [Nannizzia gypsea CBS 118893]EFR03756.1 hypothetical protein MGYG_06755 [Nannizzia gypsea CBS 118893]